MRFCFILEEVYKNDEMPGAVAERLMQWGHVVDRLEPQTTVTCLSHLVGERYDACILKTVSGGPGLSLLEAAQAAGVPAINDPRAIRLVRDKAIAASYASTCGLPTPLTYFVAHPALLQQIPAEIYPLVVKPTNGSSCRGVYRLEAPADLARFELAEAHTSFLLAQQYVENRGYDIKLYVIGTQVYAVAKRSPLHPEVAVEKRRIPVTPMLRHLALEVGRIFHLEIYGLDVVEAATGPVIVDINDFPGFGQVPHAATLISAYILQLAARARAERLLRREREQVERASQRTAQQPLVHSSISA